MEAMRILVDLDGVVADLEAELYVRAGDLGMTLVPFPQRTSAYAYEQLGHEHMKADLRAIVEAPGFFAALPPIVGAIETLRFLVGEGHDVAICTSPLLTGHCVEEKMRWVEQHLGDNWAWERMVLTRDKSRVRGDFLIDDWPTVRNEDKAEWTRVVFDQPYNRPHKVGQYRIHGWPAYPKQVEDYLRHARAERIRRVPPRDRAPIG